MGKPLLFLNGAATYTDALQLNRLKDDVLALPGPCARAAALVEAQGALCKETDVDQLTAQHESTWGPNRAFEVTDGDALLTCCALLELTARAPAAPLPKVLRPNCARVEEPEPGDAVVKSAGAGVFFQTALRDFTGSVAVGVAQSAALCLAGLSTEQSSRRRTQQAASYSRRSRTAASRAPYTTQPGRAGSHL